MKRIRAPYLFLGLTLFLILVITITRGGSSAVQISRLQGDFDGKGAFDLAVGVAHEDINAMDSAGVVQVIFGNTGSGLSGTDDQYFSEDQSALLGSAEEDDRFGNDLAAGDYNGDGIIDLAIGVPGQNVPITSGIAYGAGAVHILYGTSPDGFSLEGDQVWHQDSGTIHSLSEDYDHFGEVLVAGDFNNDGYDDLAVGVPYETWYLVESGVVQILYGSATGLSDVDNQLWRQGDSGIPGEEGTEEHFGRALSVGDFNGDGYDDLAIGVSNDEIDGKYEAGSVHILYGTEFGLTSTNNQYLYQDLTMLDGVSEGGDHFGASLAAGDFNGDGTDDLAVGVSGKSVNDIIQAGAIHIIYGSYQDGLTGAGNQIWDQETGSIQSIAEARDYFGFSLAAGYFNGDPFCDLAIGVPHEDWYEENTGIVQTLYGSSSGLTDVNNQLWRQGISGILDAEELGDRFGYELTVGDYNNDGYGDLAAGAPFEDIESTLDAGLVHIVLGSASGLISNDNQVWYQGYSGIQGADEEGDMFGWSLISIPPPTITIYLPLIFQAE